MIHIIDFDDVQDRTEGLVLHDVPVVLRSRDRRGHVGTPFAAFRVNLLATAEDLTAQLLDALDGLQSLIDCILINQRPHQCPAQRVADRDFAVELEETLDQWLAHALLHQHTARRSAALAGGTDRAEHDRARGHFQIGVIEHDDRVVATQLEDGAAKAAGHLGGHVLAHP